MLSRVVPELANFNIDAVNIVATKYILCYVDTE